MKNPLNNQSQIVLPNRKIVGGGNDNPHAMRDLIEMAKGASIVGPDGKPAKEIPGLIIPLEDDGFILYALCEYAEKMELFKNDIPVRGTVEGARGTIEGVGVYIKKMVRGFEEIFVNRHAFKPEDYRKFCIEIEKEDEDETTEPASVQKEG